MAKYDITQLEQAETVPAGSLHLIEMGDGSGTKAVTQKTLMEETGKALKIGNPEELQTENKENLVAAINEAAQSGGGGASVDILDTKEEIEANTEEGKVAGALATKAMFTELNDKLFQFEFGEVETQATSSVYKTQVSFAKPFIDPPIVLINKTDVSVQLHVVAKDVTKNGFTIYAYYDRTLPITATWIAIGR